MDCMLSRPDLQYRVSLIHHYVVPLPPKGRPTDTETVNIYDERRGGHWPPVRHRKFVKDFSATFVGVGVLDDPSGI